jgi:hypothetical protein
MESANDREVASFTRGIHKFMPDSVNTGRTQGSPEAAPVKLIRKRYPREGGIKPIKQYRKPKGPTASEDGTGLHGDKYYRFGFLATNTAKTFVCVFCGLGGLSQNELFNHTYVKNYRGALNVRLCQNNAGTFKNYVGTRPQN